MSWAASHAFTIGADASEVKPHLGGRLGGASDSIAPR
jgi:hypothetical protein